MNLSPLRIVISGVDNYSKEMAKISKQTTALSSGMKSAGQKMSMALSLPIAAAAGFSALQVAKFDDAMADAGTTTGATAAQLDGLTAAAQSMAGIGVGPAKAAEALKELGRIGMSATDATADLAPVLKMAAAAGLEVADAAGVADSVMDSFGVTAAQLSAAFDEMQLTSTRAGIGFKDLSDMMGTMGPVFREMGVSMDDALVLVRGFDSAGVEASAGVGALRKAMVALNNPSKKAVDGLRRLGLGKKDIFGNDGKMRDMVDIVDRLAKSGATAADIYQIFGDKIGANLAPLITQGSVVLQQYRADIKNAGGTIDELANKRLAKLGGTFKVITATLETAAVSIGERLAPVIVKLWSAVQPLVVAFINMPAPTMGAVIAFTALIAAIGPALVIVGSLIGAFATVTSAIAAAGGIIALVSNPIGWAVLIVGALAVAFITLHDVLAPFLAFLGGVFLVVFRVLGALITPIWAGIVDLWGAFRGLVQILTPVFTAFAALLALPIAAILTPIVAIVYALAWAFRAVAWVIKTAVDGWVLLFKVVGDFFGMIDKAMGGPVAGMLKALSDLVGNFTGKKTEIAVTGGTSAPTLPAVPGYPALATAPNAAGASAGAAAMSTGYGMPAQNSTVTIDFKNMPGGVIVTQRGTGAKITGANGPIMAGAM